MATIITRAGKGSALSANEYDENLKQETNAQASNYTVVTGDNRATVEYTGSGSESITLPDASTLLAAEDTGDFEVTIKHGGTGTLTVAFNTGDTADGVDADITLRPNDCITLKAGSVTDDWMILNLYRPLYGLYVGLTGTQVHSGAAGDYEAVVWNDETGSHYDHAGANNTSTGNITVPSMCSWFKVNAIIHFEGDAAAHVRRVVLSTTTNTAGSGEFFSGPQSIGDTLNTSASIATGWLPASLVSGTGFYVMGYQNTGGGLDMLSNYSKLFVEFK